MPYVDKDTRNTLNPQMNDVALTTPGELNYLISYYIKRYIERNGGVSYKNINEAIGVLECVKLEAYRRLASPYEDKKIKENGDVY